MIQTNKEAKTAHVPVPSSLVGSFYSHVMDSTGTKALFSSYFTIFRIERKWENSLIFYQLFKNISGP